MRLIDGLLIILFLLLALAGELLAFQIVPLRDGDHILNLLAFAVFLLGLGLAFWIARYHRQRLIREGKPEGLYCRLCGRDMLATPQRCPGCGGERTGAPMSRRHATTQAVMKFVGVTLVAVMAAAAILIHVQIRIGILDILNSPPSGH